MSDALRKARNKLSEVELRMTSTPQPSVDYPSNHARAGYLERLPLPQFSGEPLDYPEFKEAFLSLTRPANLEDAASLTYLKKSLPQKYKYLLKGAGTMSTAWARLNDKFGKPVNSVLAVLQRLMDLDLKGKPYERVEQMAFEVEQCEDLLETMEAKDRLRTEVELVTILVRKLSEYFENDWWHGHGPQTKQRKWFKESMNGDTSVNG